MIYLRLYIRISVFSFHSIVVPSDFVDGKVYAIAFADDLALLSSSPQELQAKLNLLDEKLRWFGMEINATKTEFMCFHPSGTPSSTVDPSFLVIIYFILLSFI